jgi:hypothetical protein
MFQEHGSAIPADLQPEEQLMDDLNRRLALKFGLTAAAATPLFALATPVEAAAVPNYGPTDGMDLGHGRRMVEVIPAYPVKEGGVYTCGKGKTDQATNTSNVVGIHRIALLIPA